MTQRSKQTSNSAIRMIAICAILTGVIMLLSGCKLFTPDKPVRIAGKIVFAAKVEDGNYQIFTMNTNGSNLKQLTFSDFEYGPGEDRGGFMGVTPVWSPDGKQIIFSSSYKATSIGPNIWVMEADGSNLRPLREHETQYEDEFLALAGRYPRWSPDGKKIAFDVCLNCQISTNYVIFVFDIETQELVRLTEEPPGYQSSHPSWSPDGTKIAFVSNRDYIDADTLRFRRDLYIMNADGSNQRRVTDTGYARVPVWYPIGNSILFRSTQPSVSGLYQVDIQFGDISKIKEDLSARVQLQPHAWSPDGQVLLTSVWQRYSPWSHSISLLDPHASSDRTIYATNSLNSNPAIMGADFYVDTALTTMHKRLP